MLLPIQDVRQGYIPGHRPFLLLYGKHALQAGERAAILQQVHPEMKVSSAQEGFETLDDSIGIDRLFDEVLRLQLKPHILGISRV